MSDSHPMRLSRGDTVGVVAPGFAVKRQWLRAGVLRLQAMGYRVRLGEAVLERDGYLAGADARRADDLASMWTDPEIDAIWFARGGYGSARLLDRLPWRRIRRRPKLLIGYSDLTSLFCEALKTPGQLCLYGPVVIELGDPSRYHRPSLRELLAGRPLRQRIVRRQVMAPGRASGRLVGGNLTVLSHLWGTRFAPRLDDAVLFLEDVGEQTYSVDRMLTQLRLSRGFDRLAGVLLGEFAVPRRRRFPPDRDLTDVFRETFADLGIPVVTGYPAGHMRGKRTVPLGGVAEIDTKAGLLRLVP